MKKLTLEPPRSITRNQLIARREALTELAKNQAFYLDLCIDAAGQHNPDVAPAREQLVTTRAKIDLLTELIGERA